IDRITSLELTQVRDALLVRVGEKRSLLKKLEIVTAFGKVQPILDVHERICERLEGVIERWDGDASSASEIWTEAFNDLLRVYPSYCNHCDVAVETIKTACAHSAKLRTFVEDQERSKEFKRQRIVDIMVTPVQRLPSVKLLLENLEKKTRLQSEKDQIGEAIEAIDKVLSKSNTVRQITEASISQLNLINEIQDLPPVHLKGSRFELASIEVRWICGTNEWRIKRNDTIRLILFSDSTILKKRVHWNALRSPVGKSKTFAATAVGML
ncbi:hypothetical protein KIN20_012089, partial [Parelaphostrongylus tenuis]